MQRHFGGDERFRMDERFADNDDDDDDDDGSAYSIEKDKITKDNEDNTVMNGNEEKERNLSVLESILGKNLTKTRKHQKSDAVSSSM